MGTPAETCSHHSEVIFPPRINTRPVVASLLPAPFANKLRLDTDYLDQLQDAIGKWHDASLAVAKSQLFHRLQFLKGLLHIDPFAKHRFEQIAFCL
jgi:hypothetical protein